MRRRCGRTSCQQAHRLHHGTPARRDDLRGRIRGKRARRSSLNDVAIDTTSVSNCGTGSTALTRPAACVARNASDLAPSATTAASSTPAEPERSSASKGTAAGISCTASAKTRSMSWSLLPKCTYNRFLSQPADAEMRSTRDPVTGGVLRSRSQESEIRSRKHRAAHRRPLGRGRTNPQTSPLPGTAHPRAEHRPRPGIRPQPPHPGQRRSRTDPLIPASKPAWTSPMIHTGG